VRLAVFGDPVAHSLSPALHRAALDAVGIPGSYEAVRVDEAGMAEAVASIRRGTLDGANVTMPHKALALHLVDEASSEARRAGAVNTLVRVEGRVVGHNTDISGVAQAWRWGGLPAAGPVLILGAGGAAAAAVLALQDHTITVATRRPEAGLALLERLGVVGRARGLDVPGGGMVVVNATPLGMQGEELPSCALDGAVGLFDMAYGATTTPAVRRAKERGIPVVAGEQMLLGQAMASFQLWTGRRAPEDAMRRALDASLASREASH